MAGIVDMLNQGIGGLNTPLGMLGMQLLANSGNQPGATGASRLGAAMQGVGQQQMQMQQMAMQQQLRQQQAQEIQLRQTALQAQQEQRQKLADMMRSDPNMLKNNPMAAAVLQAGGDPADAAAIGKLEGSGSPQMAKMPWTREVPNADGTTTHMEYDLNTGGYKPVSTYKTPGMLNAETNVAKTGQEMQYKPLEFQLNADKAGATVQNAQTAQERFALEQEKQAKEMEASAFKKKFERLEFKQQTRGALTELGEVAGLAEEIANSPALKSLYGPNGYIPPVAGSDAADLQTKIERLQAKGGLTELVKLKQNGVALTPVSNTDLLTAQQSFANFNRLQSDSAARETFLNAAKTVRGAMTEAQTRAQEFESLFDTPSAGTVKASGPATISDDSGYNALPSGAQFIGPDGVLRRKP